MRSRSNQNKTLPAHELGTGNIFADLGLPNAEDHRAKAAVVVQLHRLIRERKLSAVAAAKLVGVKQPDMSKILRGHHRGYPIGHLKRMLTTLGQGA